MFIFRCRGRPLLKRTISRPATASCRRSPRRSGTRGSGASCRAWTPGSPGTRGAWWAAWWAPGACTTSPHTCPDTTQSSTPPWPPRWTARLHSADHIMSRLHCSSRKHWKEWPRFHFSLCLPPPCSGVTTTLRWISPTTPSPASSPEWPSSSSRSSPYQRSSHPCEKQVAINAIQSYQKVQGCKIHTKIEALQFWRFTFFIVYVQKRLSAFQTCWQSRKCLQYKYIIYVIMRVKLPMQYLILVLKQYFIILVRC